MTIRLPFPITGSGHSKIRQKYIRHSKMLLGRMFGGIPPLQGDLAACFRFYPPDNSQRDQRRDLDNLLKPVLDAMKGIVIADDSQVKLLSAEMMEPSGAGRVTIQVYTKQ